MKFMFWFVVVVLLIGVWFGMNIANDQPLLSNPFENADIRERLVDTVTSAPDAAKEALIEKLQE